MAVKVVGSNETTFASDQLKEDKRGYGQNGFSGASSDLPTEHTTSGFLPQTDATAAYKADQNIRNRKVSNKPYPLTFGMAQRSPRAS